MKNICKLEIDLSAHRMRNGRCINAWPSPADDDESLCVPTTTYITRSNSYNSFTTCINLSRSQNTAQDAISLSRLHQALNLVNYFSKFWHWQEEPLLCCEASTLVCDTVVQRAAVVFKANTTFRRKMPFQWALSVSPRDWASLCTRDRNRVPRTRRTTSSAKRRGSPLRVCHEQTQPRKAQIESTRRDTSETH